MHGIFGNVALSGAIDRLASTLNKKSHPPANPSSLNPLWGEDGLFGDPISRLAHPVVASPMPQPGEIWQVCRSVQSPIPLSDTDLRSPYPAAVLQFLDGAAPPRYVMIVTEPDPPDGDWQTVSVMMLSVKAEFESEVDLVIAAELAGVGADLLAETWHLQRALVCNLSPVVGHRLSRPLYDVLLSVGDRHYGLIEQAPTPAELQAVGLRAGTRSVHDPTIQRFHQQEQEWASLLSRPVAACRAFHNSMQLTSKILEEALSTSRELALELEEEASCEGESD